MEIFHLILAHFLEMLFNNVSRKKQDLLNVNIYILLCNSYTVQFFKKFVVSSVYFVVCVWVD